MSTYSQLKLLLLVLCSVAFCCFSQPAYSAATCTISVLATINFGTYDITAAGPDDASGRLQVNCDGTAPPNVVPITVRLSTGASSSYFPRKLFNGASSLDYNIYRNGAHTLIWGDGLGGTVVWTTNVNLGGRRRRRMRGRIPALQSVPSGLYSNTITAEVEF